MQNKKILIADDVEMNRDLLREILEDDYQVETVEDGEKVISVLSERIDEFAVLLLDLVMPNIDGIEVLKVMNEKGWIDKLPVLIISGEQSVQSEKDCFNWGVSDFIRKPFDDTLVKKRVGNVAELSLYRRSLEQKVEEHTQRLKKVNVKVAKNKVAPPFKTCQVEIYYGEGISHVSEIISLGVDMGIIEKSGSWFSYNGEKIGQGSDAVRSFLKGAL